MVCPLDKSLLKIKGKGCVCLKGHKFKTKQGIITFFREKGLPWERKIYQYEKVLSGIYSQRIRLKNGWWEKDKSKYQNIKKGYVFTQGRGRLIDLIVKKKNGITVMDLGCGEGYVLRSLDKKLNLFNKRLHLLGSDVPVSALKRAKKLMPEVDFMSADALHLPLADETVDVMMATEVVEHIPDLKSLFTEIHRALKKDGQFVLTTPNPNSLAVWIDYQGMSMVLSFLRLITGRQNNQPKLVEQEDYDVLIDNRKLKDWLETSGFTVRQEFSEILPESFFALMEDLKVPLEVVGMVTRAAIFLENKLLPNFVKKGLGFTQIAYATKEDKRGF